MRVAIHSVDGRNYPNLALMRISAWHKARGDEVEWFSPLMPYDRVYASKVFTFTPDDPYLPPDAIRGGTGYDPASRLPPEIDAMPPDYTVYPQFSAAYGFLTRGCPNRCPWCVVPAKEGGIRLVADIERICRTNTGFRRDAILMDNNFLAAPLDFIREQSDKMRRLKIRVDFNQATDARLYNEQTAPIMAGIKWLKYIRISCDTDAMLPHCVRAMRLLRSFGYRKDFFVYVLARDGGMESALHRIYGLTSADPRAVPFVMPYRSLTDNPAEPSAGLRRLARWCNRAWIRNSCRFEDYRG
ncbi:MAG: radical SAM protein [Kiritimatiellae bacterium]|nr:radical SAM protein [Kiritimatiellia bacterium]